MKPRETRQTMLLPVRVRQEAKWTDARIRNVSSRGLMLQMESPPPRGTYVEIRRGQIIIIGEVRWSGAGSCGLRTQDKVPVEQLRGEAAAPMATQEAGVVNDRRVAVRIVTPDEIAGRSRSRARMVQTASMVAAGALGAWLAATLMYDVLQKPFGVIARHLP